MSLKKGMTSIYLVVMMVVLVGCSNKVTQKELMNHDWEITVENNKESDGIALIASFTKTSAILSFDSSNMKTESSDEYNQLGEDFAKAILSNLTYDVDYELKHDIIHLKNTDLDLDSDFNIKKDKKHIILSSPDSDETAVLVPIDKKTRSSQ